MEVWFYDEKVQEVSMLQELDISILQKLNVKFDSDYLEFSANKVAKDLNITLRKNLIEAFFRDVERGGDMARCFIPHHGIKAVFENITVEIAICYRCSLYRGQISDQKFGGAFPEDKLSESKKIFDEIIEKYSVDVR
ncbi:MAG: hypothetical protein ABJA66_21390 [Actinomycetota bacterium]